MNNTAIIIPARIDSTRLPRKLLLPIGNKPMILHVVDRAKEAGIAEVVVATDSTEIMELVQNYHTKAVMTKTSHVSGSDRIFEAISKLDSNREIKHIINLQGDMPFIKPDTIRALYNFHIHSDATINTLVCSLNDATRSIQPSVVKVAIAFNDHNHTQGKALYFSRSAIPYNSTTYYEHLGIYAYHRATLEKFINLSASNLELIEKLEQLRALENNLAINVKLVDDHPISVDVEEDWHEAIKQHQTNNA